VLRYCKNKPCFVVDEGPWYTGVFQRLGFVGREHETFGRRSKVESVFSSYKQRSRVYHWQLLTSNFKGKAEEGGQTAMVGGEPCNKPTSSPSPS
jgi:transposase-like protein